MAPKAPIPGNGEYTTPQLLSSSNFGFVLHLLSVLVSSTTTKKKSRRRHICFYFRLIPETRTDRRTRATDGCTENFASTLQGEKKVDQRETLKLDKAAVQCSHRRHRRHRHRRRRHRHRRRRRRHRRRRRCLVYLSVCSTVGEN